ncbi:MAG TPA: single-stranded DNA-binding protein [Longimicrobium sp.]
MSRCLNKATLIGYLGADPEIRTTTSGSRVAQFSLATTRRWNDREGQAQEKTQWHRIIVWDSLPGMFAFVEKYLRKGDRVYVEGEIDYRSYEDDAGVTRWTTEIKASDVLGAGEPSGQGGERGSATRRRGSTASGSARASAGKGAAVQMSAL